MKEFIAAKYGDNWHLGRIFSDDDTYRVIVSARWATQADAVAVAQELNAYNDVGEPTPEPIPEPTPEPIPEPIPEPTPDPIPEPIPEPTPDPIPEPTPDPIPEPIPGPTPDPEPTPEPDPDPPILDPTPDPIPDPTPSTGLDLASPVLGINLNALNYYSSEIPFVDVFKMSMVKGTFEWGDWGSSSGVKGSPIDLDDQGWVKSLLSGQRVETLIFKGIGGHYPTGQYTVVAEGKGSLKVAGQSQTLLGGETTFSVNVSTTDKKMVSQLKLMLLILQTIFVILESICLAPKIRAIRGIKDFWIR